MGENFDPWNHLRRSQWQFNSLNSVGNIQRPSTGQYTTNSLVLPTYISPYNSAFSVAPLLGFQGIKPQPSTLVFNPSLIPTYESPEIAGSEKRILVFDQSGNRTHFISSSSCAPSLNLDSLSPTYAVQYSNEPNLSNGQEEEMHEDTAEIDALLYSDSEYDYDEEEVSTGHSPEVMEPVSSEVASSMLPTKRRRIYTDVDASLTDTASSGVSSHTEIPISNKPKEDDDDSGGRGDDPQSSCVKGGGCNRTFSSKRLKRARIQETVSILRRIIPGGRGKDAATILDEAIRYLRCLKLRAKSMDAIPL